MTMWMKGTASAALALIFGGTALAQAPAPAQPAQQPGQPANAATPGNLPRLGDAKDLPGPIDSPKDIQDTLKMAFMAADANHDGLISKQEATDAANMIVGGLFFRADANGDGKVTQDEARQIRQQVMSQQPMLRLLVGRARRQGQNTEQAQNGLRQVANLLDENNDKQIGANEIRDAVRTGVDAIYASADTDRDGQMSPAELNAAAIGMARAAGQAAFAAADADNNGQISREEFEKAIIEPARIAFGVLDANGDGQLSQQEAQQAQQVIVSRMRVSIPDARGQQAPIPNFGSAVQQGIDRAQSGQPAQPARTQPAPAPAPAPGTPR